MVQFHVRTMLGWRNGRRARLKIESPTGRAGSSPALSTRAVRASRKVAPRERVTTSRRASLVLYNVGPYLDEDADLNRSIVRDPCFSRVIGVRVGGTACD